MKRPPLLLKVDELGLDLFEPHPHGVRTLAGFARGETAALTGWLREHRPGAALRAVVELGTEAFELEELPRVRGADRRALLARRLAASFPHPGFACAKALPESARSSRARSEQLLFSGLSDPSAIEPWMDALRAAGARVTESVPASSLAAHFGAGAAGSSAALIVHFSRAGMRLTAARSGQALFSRLAAGFPAAVAAVDARWMEELALTLDYLAGVHALALPATLPVFIHASAGKLAAGDQARADSRFGNRIEFVPLPGAHASAEGGQPARFTAAAEAALLHWLAAAPPGLGWAAGDAAPSARQRRTAFAFSAAALALALAASASAALDWSQAQALEHERRQLHAQHEQLRRQLAALDTASAEQRAGVRRMLATLAALADAGAPDVSTSALFRWLADTLAALPPASLHSLEWQWQPASEHSGKAGVAVEIGLAAAAGSALPNPSAPTLDSGPARRDMLIERLRARGAVAPRTLDASAAALRIGFGLPLALLAGDGR